MKPDISAISLFTALEQLRRREFSAVELTEACLRQIERLNPTINAFITLTPELARQGALHADALLTAQPSGREQICIAGNAHRSERYFRYCRHPYHSRLKVFCRSHP